MRCDNAPVAANPAITAGVSSASDPPAITTSASPRRIKWIASTIAITPAAHAPTPASTGPVMPSWIDVWLAAMFGQKSGIISGLTAREMEVLALVAEALSDAQVAERLFLSPYTVKAHLRSIYGKLGVSSRVAATRRVAERGLV